MLSHQLKCKSEIQLLNNDPEELKLLNLPGNWYYSRNTYEFTTEKLPKLIRLADYTEKTKTTIYLNKNSLKRDHICNEMKRSMPDRRKLKKKIESTALISAILTTLFITYYSLFLIV